MGQLFDVADLRGDLLHDAHRLGHYAERYGRKVGLLELPVGRIVFIRLGGMRIKVDHDAPTGASYQKARERWDKAQAGKRGA